MFSIITKSDKLNIDNNLIVTPKSITVNKFTEESAQAFAIAFNACLETKQSVIPIYIDSYGGQVYSLLAMLDIIKTANVPVATICLGKAMSCGSVLLSAGTDGYRFAASNSTVMIHEVSSGSHGKIEEIKADANEANRLNDKIFKMMANNCGKDDEYFKRIVHERNHADWFLDAEEARNHGLVNHIRVPKFETKVTVESIFG